MILKKGQQLKYIKELPWNALLTIGKTYSIYEANSIEFAVTNNMGGETRCVNNTIDHFELVDEKKHTPINPKHYDLPIHPIEYCLKNKMDPIQSSVIKYITRFPMKKGIEDLEKSKWFIDYAIKNYDEIYGDKK